MEFAQNAFHHSDTLEIISVKSKDVMNMIMINANIVLIPIFWLKLVFVLIQTAIKFKMEDVLNVLKDTMFNKMGYVMKLIHFVKHTVFQGNVFNVNLAIT